MQLQNDVNALLKSLNTDSLVGPLSEYSYDLSLI
jgi:hypothetical protein